MIGVSAEFRRMVEELARQPPNRLVVVDTPDGPKLVAEAVDDPRRDMSYLWVEDEQP